MRYARERRHFRRLILSQMGLADGTFAARRSRGRVVTGSIEALRFLHAIEVGDEVSC